MPKKAELEIAPLLTVPLKQQLVFLIFLVFYFVRWFVAPMSAMDWAMNIAVLATFLFFYFLAFRHKKIVLLSCFVFIALSIIGAPYNFGSNCFAIFASNFFAYTQETKRALQLIAMNLLILLGATILLDLHWIYFFLIGFIASLGSGLSAVFDRQRLMSIAKKNRSLDEAQRLAKLAERERIGQDIHDLLGHTLTVVNLKAQLASSLLEQQDYQQAKNELKFISSTTQRAIKEVREAVTGYKTHNLKQELKDQKDYLLSMGVDFEFELTNLVLTPDIDSQLMMVVREALNNVLKHAKASAAKVVIRDDKEGLHLLIEDNGIGCKDLSPSNQGNGLSGMWQRIEALGGQIKIRNQPNFCIQASIPWKPAA